MSTYYYEGLPTLILQKIYFKHNMINDESVY